MIPQSKTSHSLIKARQVNKAFIHAGKERLGEILNVQPSYAKDLTNSFLGEWPRTAHVSG